MFRATPPEEKVTFPGCVDWVAPGVCAVKGWDVTSMAAAPITSSVAGG